MSFALPLYSLSISSRVAQLLYSLSEMMLFLLELFYVTEYDENEDFFVQFHRRLGVAVREMKHILR